jgi:hypothetical protein
MLSIKPTLFTVWLFMELPGTLYVSLGDVVLVEASIKLLSTPLGFIGLLNPDCRAANSAIPHQSGFVHVGEGVRLNHTRHTTI